MTQKLVSVNEKPRRPARQFVEEYAIGAYSKNSDGAMLGNKELRALLKGIACFFS